MIKKVFTYLFLILFINISFAPVYKLLMKRLEAIEILSVIAEEEKHSETKKLMELDKEYFNHHETSFCSPFVLKNVKYHTTSSKILIYHPEQDSPPPKLFNSLS